MAFLNKVSRIATTGLVALLAVGTVGIKSVQAAIYKFSFQNEEVSGYFIYDDSATGIRPLEQYDPTYPLVEYDGSVLEYYISINSDTVSFQESGTPTQADVHDNPRTIVALSREGDQFGGYDGDGETDDFILYVPPESRGNQYGLSVRFSYEKDSFGGSLDQRTNVSSTARIRVYPYWDFPTTTGTYIYSAEVTTWIEEVPEPTSIGASSTLLLAGAGLAYRRHQRRKSLIKI